MDIMPEMVFMEACDCGLGYTMLQLQALEKLQALDARQQALQAIDGTLVSEPYFEDGGDSSATKKKQGIIKRLWDRIIMMFTSIKDFIFGKATDAIDDNAEGDIPEGWSDTVELTKLTSNLQSVSKASLVKTGLVVLAAIASVITIFKIGKDHHDLKKNRITGKDAKKLAKIYGTSADTISKACREIENFDITLATQAGNAEKKDREISKRIDDLSAKEKAATGIRNRKARKELNDKKREQVDVYTEFRKNIPPEVRQYMAVFGNASIPSDSSDLLAMIRTGLANVARVLKDTATKLVSMFATKGKGGK